MKLKKGFTLIELLVVIAIIGILVATVAPKLREQLAKAHDSKAIALLGVTRTAGSIALVDGMVKSNGGSVELAFGDITNKLGTKAYEMIDEKGRIKVGAIKDVDNQITFGGTVNFKNNGKLITKETQDINTDGDTIDLVLSTGTEDDLSTEGKRWENY